MVNPLRRLGLWLAGETKSKTTGETLPKWELGRPYRPRSPTLTTVQAIRGARSAGIVYACIRLLADTASSVPLNVYRRRGDDWEHEPTHPLQELLNSPNNRLTRRRMYVRAIQHLALVGNAIWTKIRVPRNGPPTQLWPIDPDLIKPVPDAKSFVAHYALEVDGQEVRLAPRDVVHLQLENPETPWWGIGPLQAAMLDVALYAGNKGWNLRTVQRGAVTPGVLEMPEDLSDQQYNALREQLDTRTFGHDDAGRELILGSGMKYHRMSLTGEELGFLESMKFGREEIAMIFGVPAPLLTPENATLANVEAYDRQFWQNTIVPLNLGMADILTHSLVPDFGRLEDLSIAHDYSQVPAMQENLDEQSRVAERLVRTGFTVEGVNRVLDLGFEDEEIRAPPGPPGTEQNGQADPDAEQPEGEDKARRQSRSVKRLSGGELAAIARAADAERQTWEAEIALRINAVLASERDAVVARFKEAGNDAAVIAAVHEHASDWTALLTGTNLAVAQHFAKREYDRLAPSGRKALDPLVIATEWASRTAAAKVVGITDTTIKVLRGVIAAGLEVDENGFRRTTDEIAGELADTYDSWMFRPGAVDLSMAIDARAMMIARTEIGMAMNFGHEVGGRQVAEEFDLRLEATWSSSLDDRVRESHRLLHGETVALGARFSNGLRYPGDPEGEPEEVINCRCVLVHQIVR